VDFLTVFPYHYSGDKIKHEMGGGGGHVVYMGEWKGTNRVLVGKN
jgi:hypothetical protein